MQTEHQSDIPKPLRVVFQRHKISESWLAVPPEVHAILVAPGLAVIDAWLAGRRAMQEEIVAKLMAAQTGYLNGRMAAKDAAAVSVDWRATERL